jgi:hypothetical protein
VNIPAEITAKFDSLLGGTLAAGVAALKAYSQLGTPRSFDVGGKQLTIKDASYYREGGNQLPYLFKVTIEGGSRDETVYLNVDAKSGDITEVIEGSARDDRGDLLWEEADEALRETLFGILRDAARCRVPLTIEGRTQPCELVIRGNTPADLRRAVIEAAAAYGAKEIDCHARRRRFWKNFANGWASWA